MTRVILSMAALLGLLTLVGCGADGAPYAAGETAPSGLFEGE